MALLLCASRRCSKSSSALLPSAHGDLPAALQISRNAKSGGARGGGRRGTVDKSEVIAPQVGHSIDCPARRALPCRSGTRFCDCPAGGALDCPGVGGPCDPLGSGLWFRSSSWWVDS